MKREHNIKRGEVSVSQMMETKDAKARTKDALMKHLEFLMIWGALLHFLKLGLLCGLLEINVRTSVHAVTITTVHVGLIYFSHVKEDEDD